MDRPEQSPDPEASSSDLHGVPTRPPTVAATRHRESIRTLQRQLTESDLKNPGAQRLILEDWERAEAECEELRVYVDRYYEAERRSAVLQAQLQGLTKVDTLFGTMLAVGGALIGMVPSLGWPTATAGAVLCLTAVFIRARK